MKTRKPAPRVLLGMIFSVMVAGLYFIEPGQVPFLPSCPLHTLTGVYCPGCGSTRALHQLLHGQFGAALRFNPLAVVGLPLLGCLAVCRRESLCKPWLGWMLLGIVVVFGVLRNLPLYPFTLLTP